MFKEFAIRSVLVLFGGCLGLFIVELALRLFIPSNNFMVLTPNLSHVYKFPYEQLPGMQKSVLIESNQWGYKGRKQFSSDKFGILTIGGSTTESNSVNLEDSWPYLLEGHINRDSRRPEAVVVNVGKSGLNSGHHVLHMKHLIQQFKNVDLVLMLVGINDFNRRLMLGEKYFATKNDKTLMKRAFSVYPRYYNNIWYEKTELWIRLRQMKSIWKRSELRGSKDYSEMIQQFRIDYASIEKSDLLPDLSRALQDYTDNLVHIAKIAKQHDVRLVWITQPTLWGEELVDDMEVYGATHFRTSEGHAYSITSLEKGVNKFNDVLLDVGAKEEIEVIDLAAVLPKDTTVFYDFCHYNRNGMKEVAKILYDSLSHLTIIK